MPHCAAIFILLNCTCNICLISCVLKKCNIEMINSVRVMAHRLSKSLIMRLPLTDLTVPAKFTCLERARSQKHCQFVLCVFIQHAWKIHSLWTTNCNTWFLRVRRLCSANSGGVLSYFFDIGTSNTCYNWRKQTNLKRKTHARISSHYTRSNISQIWKIFINRQFFCQLFTVETF